MDTPVAPPCIGNRSVSEGNPKISEGNRWVSEGSQDLGSQTGAEPPGPDPKPQKKPLSESWLGNFLQQLVLLGFGFALTGVCGALVTEHVKHSFAIQDLKIALYKTGLDEQRKFSENLLGKINNVTIKTALWSIQLQKYSETPQADDAFRDYLIENVSVLRELGTMSNQFVVTFCGNDESFHECFKQFDEVSKQIEKIMDSLVYAMAEDKFEKPKDLVASQKDLIRKSGELEKFMFNKIMLTRQRYEAEIIKQPWW